MRAILERDFLSFVKQRRFYAMRMGVVFSPLLCLGLVTTTMENMPRDWVGRMIFGWTAIPLLLMVIFVAPSMFAYLLVEERRNNKLDVLRSAPISATQIVLGKWSSRVALLGVAVVAALPLVAISLLWGGIAPGHVLQGAAVLLATVLWTGALSTWVSATSRELGTAIRAAYLVIVLTLLGPWLLQLLLGVAMRGFGNSTLNEVFGLVTMLNPIYILASITEGRPSMLGIPVGYAYTLVSLLVSALFLAFAVRAIAREPRPSTSRARRRSEAANPGWRVIAGLPAPSPAARSRSPFSRLPALLARHPVLWLEIGRGRGRPRRARRILLFALLVLLEVLFLTAWSRSRGTGPTELHLFAIWITFLLAIFATAGIGAATFQRDGEANTLEVLHATPLTNAALARGKIRGTLHAALPWWGFSLAHAAFAVICGDYPEYTLFAYVVASGVLLLALAGFSMVRSLGARNAARATVRTMSIVAAHLFISPLILMLVLMAGRSGSEETLIGLLFGHHPLFIVTLPYVLAEGANIDEVAFWLYPLLYLLGYAALAAVTLGSTIPRRYAEKRDDRRPLPPATRPAQPFAEMT